VLFFSPGARERCRVADEEFSSRSKQWASEVSHAVVESLDSTCIRFAKFITRRFHPIGLSYGTTVYQQFSSSVVASQQELWKLSV
jgi:hypothetical protein